MIHGQKNIIFLSLHKLVVKKASWVELHFERKKYVCIPRSFLVMHICNQGKTLCSPCTIQLSRTQKGARRVRVCKDVLWKLLGPRFVVRETSRGRAEGSLKEWLPLKGVVCWRRSFRPLNLNQLNLKKTSPCRSIGTMTAYRGREGIAPFVRNLGTSSRWVDSFTLPPFYLEVQNPSISRWLGGLLENRGGLDISAETKNLFARWRELQPDTFSP
jgi:hypothetical protein